MKTLHVIPSISPVRGGTSHAVLDMALALQQRGVDVEIATTNDHGSDTLPVSLNERIQYNHIPTYFFPRWSSGVPSLQEFNFSDALTIWLWKNVANYDIVHIHALFSYPATVAMAIARIKKIPYITTPHGLLCHWSLQQSTRKKQLFLQLIERSNLSNSSALHLTSQKEQQEVADLCLPTASFVLPLGLNMPRQIPNASQHLRKAFNINDSAPIILFMGRIHHKKGLDYLITALGRSKHLPFHFLLVGDGEPEYKLEISALLKSADIEDRTYRPGFVEGAQKDAILQGSNLFALTSHSENFGVAVLEALAAGVPTLLTPGVALSTLVAEQRLGYITDLNVESICASLSEALQNQQANAEIGQRAHHFIKTHYTCEQTALKLTQVYANILAKGSVLQHA